VITGQSWLITQKCDSALSCANSPRPLVAVGRMTCHRLQRYNSKLDQTTNRTIPKREGTPIMADVNGGTAPVRRICRSTARNLTSMTSILTRNHRQCFAGCGRGSGGHGELLAAASG